MLDFVLFARSRNFILRCAIFAASAVLLAGFSEPCLAAEFKTIHLWEKGAPGTPATKPQDEPELYVKLPTAPSTGTAVIILPGGGINSSNGLYVARKSGAGELHSGLGSVLAYGHEDYVQFENEVRALAAQLASVA